MGVMHAAEVVVPLHGGSRLACDALGTSHIEDELRGHLVGNRIVGGVLLYRIIAPPRNASPFFQL